MKINIQFDFDRKTILTAEHGGSSLLMVMIVMMLAMLLIAHSQDQVTENMRLLRQEVRYLVDINNSHSALNWGRTIDWNISDIGKLNNWYCVTQTYAINESPVLEACLKKASKDETYIFRARTLSKSLFNLPLYQFVKFTDPEATVTNLNLVNQSWFDFCPERNEKLCEE